MEQPLSPACQHFKPNNALLFNDSLNSTFNPIGTPAVARPRGNGVFPTKAGGSGAPDDALHPPAANNAKQTISRSSSIGSNSDSISNADSELSSDDGWQDQFGPYEERPWDLKFAAEAVMLQPRWSSETVMPQPHTVPPQPRGPSLRPPPLQEQQPQQPRLLQQPSQPTQPPRQQQQQTPQDPQGYDRGGAPCRNGSSAGGAKSLGSPSEPAAANGGGCTGGSVGLFLQGLVARLTSPCEMGDCSAPVQPLTRVSAAPAAAAAVAVTPATDNCGRDGIKATVPTRQRDDEVQQEAPRYPTPHPPSEELTPCAGARPAGASAAFADLTSSPNQPYSVPYHLSAAAMYGAYLPPPQAFVYPYRDPPLQGVLQKTPIFARRSWSPSRASQPQLVRTYSLPQPAVGCSTPLARPPPPSLFPGTRAQSPWTSQPPIWPYDLPLVPRHSMPLCAVHSSAGAGIAVVMKGAAIPPDVEGPAAADAADVTMAPDGPVADALTTAAAKFASTSTKALQPSEKHPAGTYPRGTPVPSPAAGYKQPHWQPYVC